MRRIHLAALVAVAGTLAVVTAAVAGGGQHIREHLTGYEEVPALSTTGEGKFRAEVRNGQIVYRLSYAGLEGNVTQAHIHLGNESVNGGISVWLCASKLNPPPGPPPPNTPECPGTTSGEVSDTVDSTDVIGPAAQGITAGEFAELLRAIRAGATYANVHTTKYGGGEIRAQLEDDHHEDDDD